MLSRTRVFANFGNYFHFYLFTFILLTLSPFGNLSGNEEMYYGLANKFLNPEWNGQYSSFIFSGNYRALSDLIIGTKLKYLGFELTQISGSVLTSLIFTHAIYKLCKTLDLNNVYGLLAIIVFILLGQSFIGREWIFEDFEAKVFAYYFVILAINAYTKEKSFKMVLFLSAATYFHLLIGVSWLGLLGIAALVSGLKFRIFLQSIGSYFFLCVPILFVAINGFYGSEYIQDRSVPSPSYIYSYIRQYKMVVPFYSLPRFILQWLPGITIYAGILAALWVSRGLVKNSFLQRLNTLIVSSIVILFIFLIISVFDTNGSFAKYYPYRFTSLLLLLILFYTMSNLRNGDIKSNINIGPVLLIAILPFFVINGGILSFKEIHFKRQENPAKNELYQYLLANSALNEIILIDPEIEKPLFDLERKLNRATLVTFKYIPSSKEGLVEWYKRREFKARVFLSVTEDELQYPYNFVITKGSKNIENLASTHTKIFANADYTVFKK